MTPVDQTKFGKPEGNCLAAAVASITGIPIDEFPDLSDAEDPASNWGRRVEVFMRARGWELLFLVNAKGQEFLPTGYHIGGGMSPRGVMHACVFLDGHLAHDPHPSRDGIGDVREWMLIFPKPRTP